jgi:tRNA A37 N6-isopentenylltransferase MiaA
VERARGIELIKRNSRHYARRQLSWYRSATGTGEVSWAPHPDAVDLADLTQYLAGL